MSRIRVGIACALMVFQGGAVSDGYSRSDDGAQDRVTGQVLLAGSGDNPWALPDPRTSRGRLPEYITNPKYATDEDRETKLNYGKQDERNSTAPAQQPNPQVYGAPLSLPAMPNIYVPNSGTPYGYQPGYPIYPGFGGLPGLGTPYMGDPGFGGNPLLSPYGNIYGYPVPYTGGESSSGSD